MSYVYIPTYKYHFHWELIHVYIEYIHTSHTHRRLIHTYVPKTLHVCMHMSKYTYTLQIFTQKNHARHQCPFWRQLCSLVAGNVEARWEA